MGNSISLNEIKKPINDEIDIFNSKFKASLKSSVMLLDKISMYLIKSKGKQMRPIFILLSANICGKINESTYRFATMVELLHTATLIHDDVVDDSYKRRGFFSINALWKNKVAVLVGDYLLSKGLLISLNNDDFKTLKLISNTVKSMSEAEILQIQKARKLDIEEDIYFEIIRKKTASLISTCCAGAAMSVNSSEEIINKMQLIGEYIGIAFQIKDDLFDYEEEDTLLGKPRRIDIKEQKMTLPLIYLLKNSGYTQKKEIINIIKNHNTDNDKISKVIELVKSSGGIEYTKNKMLKYQNKALELINDFPPSVYKNSLEQLIYFTVNRNS
ncbi:MAG: polyprenyl synthetase family protein [Bacteroidota bacterium]|nr:polyprenyl synthetase family protein [Bacteroidota bacterium]